MKNWHLFSRKTKNVEEKWNVKTMFGANLGFAAAENFVFYLVFVLAYAAAHLLFTLAVHKRWNGERLRVDVPTTERKPYM